jgi:hypothetical protein
MTAVRIIEKQRERGARDVSSPEAVDAIWSEAEKAVQSEMPAIRRRLAESRVRNYINENFPKGVNVPTGVSDDEAIQAVQQQFRDAGFDCPDETARGLVHEAYKRQQQEPKDD